MRKIIVFTSMILFLGITLCSAQEESMTITTYYPSPYGSYNELRLYPHSPATTSCNSSQQEGLMYYDLNTHNLYVCRYNGTTYAWESGGGYWTQSGSSLYPNNTNWNVGIRTTAPNATLQVIGAISRQGSTLTGTQANVDSQVNLGVSSTTSNSYSSVAGGRSNTASGNYSSVAGGFNSTASGDYSSVGGGFSNTASGTDSFVAGGWRNIASGEDSFVGAGRFNIASGRWSFVAGGFNSTASDLTSWAGGYRAKAIHSGSFVWADYQNIDYSSNGANTFNIRASGGIYYAGGKIHDIAEFMDVLKKEQVSQGEIVSLKQEQKLGKSSGPYDKHLLGVVSSKRTTTLHLGDTQSEDPDVVRLPIALAGQVYVKVSDEAGEIGLGDPITSSSLPGIGMKANRSGRIVGYAMQSCNFEHKDTEEILVFVSLGHYVKEAELTRLLEEIRGLKEELKELKQKLLPHPEGGEG